MKSMAHECDCGAVYQNLDALMACQNANHGRPRKTLLQEAHEDLVRKAVAAERKRCALIAQKIGTELGEPAIGFAVAEKIRKAESE